MVLTWFSTVPSFIFYDCVKHVNEDLECSSGLLKRVALFSDKREPIRMRTGFMFVSVLVLGSNWEGERRTHSQRFPLRSSLKAKFASFFPNRHHRRQAWVRLLCGWHHDSEGRWPRRDHHVNRLERPHVHPAPEL